MSEISTSRDDREGPEVEISPQPTRIEVTLDTGTAFGYSWFVVDSPQDDDWRRSRMTIFPKQASLLLATNARLPAP